MPKCGEGGGRSFICANKRASMHESGAGAGTWMHAYHFQFVSRKAAYPKKLVIAPHFHIHARPCTKIRTQIWSGSQTVALTGTLKNRNTSRQQCSSVSLSPSLSIPPSVRLSLHAVRIRVCVSFDCVLSSFFSSSSSFFFFCQFHDLEDQEDVTQPRIHLKQ